MTKATRQYAVDFIRSYYFCKTNDIDMGLTLDFDLAKFKKGYTRIVLYGIRVTPKISLIDVDDIVTIEEFVKALGELEEYEILAYVMDYFNSHDINTSMEEL